MDLTCHLFNVIFQWMPLAGIYAKSNNPALPAPRGTIRCAGQYTVLFLAGEKPFREGITPKAQSSRESSKKIPLTCLTIATF